MTYDQQYAKIMKMPGGCLPPTSAAAMFHCPTWGAQFLSEGDKSRAMFIREMMEAHPGVGDYITKLTNHRNPIHIMLDHSTPERIFRSMWVRAGRPDLSDEYEHWLQTGEIRLVF